MIVFDKVNKQYGGRKVLDNITLKIEPQEFVSIIGPSGAGKSTLVHALIGAEKLNSGEIFVDDYHVHVMSENALQLFRRKLGIIFQDYKLIPSKNVFENVAFALEATGASNSYIKEKVDEVLNVVGLTELKGHFPYQLSGGEQQKVAIARALAHDPKLVIADEPTGNLDPKSAKEILDLFKKINKNGATILFASHNKGLVDKLKKRVVRLENGKVISDEAHGKYEF